MVKVLLKLGIASLLMAALNTYAGVKTTTSIDTYTFEFDSTAIYERKIFECDIAIDSATTGPTFARITPKMNIVKVHNDDYRLQAIDENGETSLFLGNLNSFDLRYLEDWHYHPYSYTHNTDNDFDAPWFKLNINRDYNRYYSGQLTMLKDYYQNSETLVSYDMNCTYIEDYRGNAGTSSLMQAAMYGDTDRITNLLKTNVNIDHDDDNGFTTLMYAVINGYSQSTKLLIDAGADLNKTNIFGNDALNYALASGNQYIAWLLTEAGATGKATSLAGATALSLALENGLFSFMLSQGLVSTDVLPSVIVDLSIAQLEQLLTFEIDINAQSEAGVTGMHLAAGMGDLEKVNTLIAAGAQIDIADNYGSTPLALSIYHEAIAKRLVDAGAKVVNNGQVSALHKVLQRGDFGLANYMLDHAEINFLAINNQGYDLLISATSFFAKGKPGQMAMLERLIRQGSNAGFVAADGNTALIQASRDNLFPLVKLLVENGAQLDSISSFGITALGYARIYKHQAIVNYLLGAGADPSLGRQPL